MADLKETQRRHGQDVVAGNMAGIMGDFTPAGMSKVTAMMAADPITASGFEIGRPGRQGSRHQLHRRHHPQDLKQVDPGRRQLADQ